MRHPAELGYEISTSYDRLQRAKIYGFLHNESYWARGIPEEVFERSLQNSIVFGVYLGDEQAGFGRVITDKSTFALLSDVFIFEKHRGFGLSKWLVENIILHDELQGLRRMLLFTIDAQGLYQKYGFSTVAAPERCMEIVNPDVYRDGLSRP